MTVLVVGAGTMGRWVAKTLDAPVAFADTDPNVAADAASTLGDGRVATDEELAETNGNQGSESRSSADGFETVVVAVPLPAAADAIERYAPLATSAIVDVTGEMEGPVGAMREHAPGLERLSLHPLFAPENAPGTIAAVHDETGPATTRIREALVDAGNDVFDTTPSEHDDAMASVQSATHTAILAWQLAVDDVREEFHTPLSSELAALAAHVTDHDPRVYADIADRYPEGRKGLATAASELANADRDGYTEAFERARNKSRSTELPDGEDE
jgi:prephenate dehydrogenase